VANRTVSVALVADVGRYQSAMTQAAVATKKVGTDASEAGSKAQRGFDLAGRGATILGGVLAGGVALGIRSVVGAASDLNETLNKSDVIFGENAGRIERWASGAADSFGLSKQAALEAAASFGNMFQQLGFTGGEAVNASESVVKLAADLGSFNNLETGNVLERIQAAFRGEYDSLQLLIPNINAARVEQEAMAETGKANADQLTAQEKATAVLAIVQRDGAAAANDFAETADGLANSTKITTAEFEDLKAKIGQQFLPIAQDAMHFLSDTAIPVVGELAGGIADLATWFGDLPGPVQLAAGAAVAWAVAGDRILAGLKPMGGLITPLRGTVSAFGEALSYARANGDGLGTVLQSVGSYAGGQALTGIKKLAKAIGPELGIAAAVFVVGELVDGFQSLTQASDEAQAAAEGLAGSLTLIDEAADRKTIRSTIEDVDGLVEALDAAGVSSEDAINGLLGQADAQERVTHALEVYMATQRTAQTGGDAADVREAINNYEELATGYGNAAGNARYFADESGGAAEGAAATGTAAEESLPQIDEAADAVKKWREQLQQVGSSFVEPLDIYKGLLQDAAQATADATSSAKDSWSDYAADSKVSLDDFATTLEDQINAQNNWRTNLVTIAQRGGIEVAQALEQMGVEGAGFVQQMVNANAEDFGHMRDLMIQDANLGGAGAAAALDDRMKVMAAVGEQGAKATVEGIAAQLGIGADRVREIASSYGVHLAEGVNPLLLALGKPIVNAVASRPGGAQAAYNADGNLYEKHDAQIAAGGAMRVWAEPETGGEAYIPLAPAKRGRSMDIWRQTGKLLNAPEAQFFAGGGFYTEADIPRPYSTAPYGPPLSSGGDAAMDTAYEATADYVRESGPFGRALAWARSQVGKPYIWGGVGPEGYDCSGFQSAITNVLLGLDPYSRRGSTATFPWSGFVTGDGVYTVGSTPNAGGGIGHMAGTLLNVNVESRGGDGVVVGGSARGAHDSLFGTRAHLAMFNGGVIGEPVFGFGARSGNSYSFGEHGPEVVLPTGREFSGSSGGGGGGANMPAPQVTVHFHVDGEEFRGMTRTEITSTLTSGNRALAARGVR
jgi:hypothetical protein